jgi:hypothetical protein
MRARMSILLAGFGKFVAMTSAFCLAMTIAITGPPTPSETAGVSAIVDRAVRRFDSTALDFNSDLCRRAAVIAHAAGLCAAPATVLVRKGTAQSVQVAAVSQTLPPSAQEILAPDTLDQIVRPQRRPGLLLGAAPSLPRHVARAAHPPRVAARASPLRNRALAFSRSRTQHVATHLRRAPAMSAVRAAAANAHTVHPSRRTRASAVRATVRPAPRPAPVLAAPAAEHPRPHEDSPSETTLDEQLERLTAPPDNNSDEPASDDEDWPPDEKS